MTLVLRYESLTCENQTYGRCLEARVRRIVDGMVLTILLAAPGVLVLLVLAATPLFVLWDGRASQRSARPEPRPVAPVTPVAVPAPRDPVRTPVATR